MNNIGHWYPQTEFLKTLVDYVQNTRDQTKIELQKHVLKSLKQEDYPYILVSYIVREGLMRRNNQ